MPDARTMPIHASARRRFPALPESLPWSWVEPHDAQCLVNHCQSLDRIALRGGLTPAEALDIVKGQPWGTTRGDEDRAFEELARIKSHG